MAIEDQDINSQNSVFHAVSGKNNHLYVEDQDINRQNSGFHAVSGRDRHMVIEDQDINSQNSTTTSKNVYSSFQIK